MSQAEDNLMSQIQLAELPCPIREYRFAAEHVGLGKAYAQDYLKLVFVITGLIFAGHNTC